MTRTSLTREFDAIMVKLQRDGFTGQVVVEVNMNEGGVSSVNVQQGWRLRPDQRDSQVLTNQRRQG